MTHEKFFQFHGEKKRPEGRLERNDKPLTRIENDTLKLLILRKSKENQK